MRSSRWLAWVPVMMVAVLAALTWWLDQRVAGLNPGRQGGAHEPDFIIEQFNARRLNAEGTERYAMQATKLVHYRDDSSATVESPRMTDYAPGKAPLSINARSGRLSSDASDAYFYDAVEVRRGAWGTHEPMSLTTDFLHVIPDRDLVITDRPVVLTNGNSVIRSVGLEFDNRAHTLKLLGRVRGEFPTPPKLAAGHVSTGHGKQTPEPRKTRRPRTKSR